MMKKITTLFTILLLAIALTGCVSKVSKEERDTALFKESKSTTGSIFGEKAGESGKIFGSKSGEKGNIFGDEAAKSGSIITGEVVLE
jgi:hypothetical protein